MQQQPLITKGTQNHPTSLSWHNTTITKVFGPWASFLQPLASFSALYQRQNTARPANQVAVVLRARGLTARIHHARGLAWYVRQAVVH